MHQHQHQHPAPPQHHPQQHPHQAAQAHAQAQAQAAAAAAALAQQQHYNRIAANNNNASSHALHVDRAPSVGSVENGAGDDYRRVLGWITELMSGSSREAALLELSKKREQVPELAMILWHSFGE